jgi:hypothetical protein
MLGFLIGYLLATLSESLLHRTVGHATCRSRRFWKRLPFISGILSLSYFRHGIVHHLRTFKANHITQFVNDAEQQHLDGALQRAHQERFIELQYGLTTNIAGALHFVALPILLAIVASLSIFQQWNLKFLIGAIVPIVITPVLSICLHPYLHMTQAMVDSVAPRYIRWILSTRYGKWVRKAHFVHHRNETVNFNLLPGGDLLFRTYRSPTEDDLQEMQRIGLL